MIEVNIKDLMAVQPQLGGISGSRQFSIFASLLQIKHPASALSFDSTLGCNNAFYFNFKVHDLSEKEFFETICTEALHTL